MKSIRRAACTGALIVLAVACGCSRTPGIERGFSPVETAYVEAREGRIAVARALGLTVALEPVAPADWEKILEAKAYVNKEHRATMRVPSLVFFQLTVLNERDAPLPVAATEARISYGTQVKKAIPWKDLAAQLTSPAYSLINFAALGEPHRLTIPRFAIADIDYSENLVELKNATLAPGERMITFLAFDWLPVEVRGFKLTVYPEADRKKSIDFEFTRFEYRTKGERFRKTEKEEREPY